MNVTLADTGSACHLAFEGRLTCASACEMEDLIAHVSHFRGPLEVDLSKVEEIDLHGIHFLGRLEAIGEGRLRVVNSSPAVARAYERLTPRRGHWLRGCGEERAGKRP